MLLMFANTRPLRRIAIAAAGLLLSGSPLLAQDAAPDAAQIGTAQTCAARYHQSLAGITTGAYAAIRPAQAAAQAGDFRLPGIPTFPPQGRQRTRVEIAALNAGLAMVRGRGRAVWTGDADRVWIADRLRGDLGDYLGQKLSPYLCGGVPRYLETLRGFAERVGASPERRKAFVETQRGSVRAVMRDAMNAMAAMAPAQPIEAAPAPAEAAPAASGLRPAAGITRVEPPVSNPASAEGVRTKAAAETRALDGPKDLVAAIDDLMAAAEAARIMPATVDHSEIVGAISATSGDFPVLARLGSVKAALAGQPVLVKDRAARRQLTGALSEIELLDYLMRGANEAPDETATAIHATLDAIRAAYEKDCTCGK